MTPQQYLKTLARLGLTSAGKRTCAVLGLSMAQVQRYAHGNSEIPEPVAKLLRMYVRFGIPEDL